MKKYALIGSEIILSIVLVVVIVILIISIRNNNSKDGLETDSKSIQVTQEMANETASSKSEEKQQSSLDSESNAESTEAATEAITEMETEIVTEAVVEETVQAEESIKEADNVETENIISIDKLNELVSENIFMIMSVFNGSPTILTNETSGTYIKVDTNVFADYADFLNRVYSVYSKNQADYYITTGYPGYTDLNGELYFDSNYMAGGGYYVIWDGYTVTVNDNSDNKCAFTINVNYQGPYTYNHLTDYYINGSAVYEDGRWVLEKMLRD